MNPSPSSFKILMTKKITADLVTNQSKRSTNLAWKFQRLAYRKLTEVAKQSSPCHAAWDEEQVTLWLQDKHHRMTPTSLSVSGQRPAYSWPCPLFPCSWLHLSSLSSFFERQFYLLKGLRERERFVMFWFTLQMTTMPRDQESHPGGPHEPKHLGSHLLFLQVP